MALLRDCGIAGSVGGAQVGGKYRTTLKRAPAIVEKIRSLQQLANKAGGPGYPALPVRANTIGTFRYHCICALRASVALMTEEYNGDRAVLGSHNDGQQSWR